MQISAQLKREIARAGEAVIVGAVATPLVYLACCAIAAGLAALADLVLAGAFTAALSGLGVEAAPWQVAALVAGGVRTAQSVWSAQIRVGGDQ